MNHFLLIGITQSLFFALLIFTKKRKQVADIWVGIWFLIICFNLLFFYCNFNYSDFFPEIFAVFGFFVPFVYGPINYFYIKKLTKKVKIQIGELLIHFLPYLFFVGAFLYLQFNSSERLFRIEHGEMTVSIYLPFFLQFYGVFMAIHGGSYCVYNYFLVKRYQQKLRHQFSNLEKINLNWLKNFSVVLLIGFFLIFFSIYFEDDIEQLFSLRGIHFIGLILIAEIFYLGYFATRQSNLFSVIANNLDEKPIKVGKYQKSKLTNDQIRQWTMRLEAYMLEEKPYEDSNLSLTKLAQQIEISPNYLSQIINTYYQKNFFDYINSFRIELVKSQLINPEFKHWTILAIAMESGFNSKSAFNAAFKKQEGKTPSQFKRELSRKIGAHQ